MARNSAGLLKMARCIAIAQTVSGGLLFGFGIGEIVLLSTYTAVISFGIWCGIWVALTGGLGIPGTSTERTSFANIFMSVYMGFSSTSILFAVVGISGYSIALDFTGDYDYNQDQRSQAGHAFMVIILTLSVINFVLGILSLVCCCYLVTCKCCARSAQQDTQVVYVTNPGMPAGGYVIAQGPGAVPVAVPVQGGGGAGMAAVQVPTSTVMGRQTQTPSYNPQVVQVPVSGQMDPAGAMGDQPQYVQYGAVPSYAAMGVNQSQEEEIPVTHSAKKTFV